MRRLPSVTFPLFLFLVTATLNATCPTPTLLAAWQNGVGVNYSWWVPQGGPPPNMYNPIPIPNLGIDSDIFWVYSLWTYSNQSQNNTGVTFYFASGGGAWRVMANQVNYPGVINLDPGVPAQTQMFYLLGTQAVVEANTTFFYGSLSPFGYATTDPNAANYHTFIQKVMLHEVGHTIGLSDQPIGPGVCGGQIAGQSVMNAECGTNDSANNMPSSGVQACDNASVH